MIRRKFSCDRSWRKKRERITQYGFRNAKESKMDKKPSESSSSFCSFWMRAMNILMKRVR